MAQLEDLFSPVKIKGGFAKQGTLLRIPGSKRSMEQAGESKIPFFPGERHWNLLFIPDRNIENSP